MALTTPDARSPGSPRADRRLLFVTRRPPYPLDNGARIRAYQLIRGLSSRFATTLLSYAHDPASPDGAVDQALLAASLPETRIVLASGLGAGKRSAQMHSLLHRKSWEFGRYELPSLRNELRHIRATEPPDLVHLDDPGAAAFASECDAATVFAPHNVEHRILRGNARAASAIRRGFGEVEWRKVHREERAFWRNADLCLAVSELDAETMLAGGARAVQVCPNGTERRPQLDPPRREEGEPFRILFVGSGRYRPYEVGLAWFVKHVYPRILEQVDATFEVVGNPPQHPRQAPGVAYRGRVDSVVPHYRRAHAVVIPVFEGSGTRLKIVEAMALGRPVVSTRLGAEGLGLHDDAHYLAADDAATFARHLVELAHGLERGEWPTTMLSRARAAAEPLFWDRIVERLAIRYHALIDSVSRTPA